mmetsp:Transcript_27352/g.65739  ORF Transcript_27352/g.65739 Transcript_27352/m.65739 type:complete len:91 (+) Transcript_27352:2422-2694(+)
MAPALSGESEDGAPVDFIDNSITYLVKDQPTRRCAHLSKGCDSQPPRSKILCDHISPVLLSFLNKEICAPKGTQGSSKVGSSGVELERDR